MKECCPPGSPSAAAYKKHRRMNTVPCLTALSRAAAYKTAYNTKRGHR